MLKAKVPRSDRATNHGHLTGPRGLVAKRYASRKVDIRRSRKKAKAILSDKAAERDEWSLRSQYRKSPPGASRPITARRTSRMFLPPSAKHWMRFQPQARRLIAPSNGSRLSCG